MEQQTAIVTGASRGLGLALATALVEDGWKVVVDARHADELTRATAVLGDAVVAVPGDITDPAHRRALVTAAGDGLDPGRQQRRWARPVPPARPGPVPPGRSGVALSTPTSSLLSA